MDGTRIIPLLPVFIPERKQNCTAPAPLSAGPTAIKAVSLKGEHL